MSILVLDTETTGFSRQDDVVEIGAVIIDPTTRTEIGSFSSLVRSRKTDGLGMGVHGIPPSCIESAPHRMIVWRSFSLWMTSLGPVTKVSSFGLPFDRRLMTQTFGEEVEALPWGTCLMKIASTSDRLGHLGKVKLSGIAQELNIVGTFSHRAVDDARVAAEIWKIAAQEAQDRRHSQPAASA